MPQDTINNVTDYLKGIYGNAIAKGDLTALNTKNVTDNEIEEQLFGLWTKYKNCKGIYYDPYHMSAIATRLEERGVNMISVSQSTGNMSEPSKLLESLIKDKLVRYNSGLFEYAASCAMMSMTKENNIKIYKEAPKVDKIDPIIATIIALSGATLQKADEIDIYNHRGMLVL